MNFLSPQPPRSNFPHYHFAVLLAVAVSSIFFTIWATAGTLTPGGAPGGTMKTLQEIYDSVAGTTFNSSSITADQNGSVIEGLKYINANLGWASASNNIYNLNTGGNVGIGTTNPSFARMAVYASSSNEFFLPLGIKNGAYRGYSAIDFFDYLGNDVMGIGYANPGATYNPGTMYINAQGGLQLNTFATTRISISSAGNVGIGSSYSPDSKLDIAGNILASASANVSLTLRSSTTNGASNNEDAKFTLRTGSSSESFDIINGAGTKLVTIASGGNIGIGSGLPYPGSIVSVTGAVVGINQTTVPFSYDEFIGALSALPAAKTWSNYSNRELRVQSFNPDAGSYGQAILYNGRFTHATGGTPPYTVFHQGNFQRASGIIFDGGDTMFITNPGATGSGSMPMAEALRIKYTGNIGVGTSDPTTRFDIRGSAGNYDIFNIASSSGTSILRVSKSGNVGIGTTSPTALSTAGTFTNLNISNTSTAGHGKLTLSSSGTSNGLRVGSIVFGTSGSSASDKRSAYITSDLSGDSSTTVTGDLLFFTNNGGSVTERMRILANGNVGIGSSAPTSKLNISGGNCSDDAGGGGCTADYAEYYPASEDMEKGDLVMADVSSLSYAVKKARGNVALLGIVSSAPAAIADGGSLQLMNNHYVLDPRKPAVALVGRAPLKVSLENGPIQTGDRLIASSIPGIAMKATRPGMTVGIALEPLGSIASGSYQKVLTFVNVGYWVPEDYVPSGNSLVQLDTPSLLDQMLQRLGSVFNIVISNGLIKTVQGVFDRIEVKEGVTIQDQITGAPYCLTVANGTTLTKPGACGQ